jgi:hypothetical protein
VKKKNFNNINTTRSNISVNIYNEKLENINEEEEYNNNNKRKGDISNINILKIKQEQEKNFNIQENENKEIKFQNYNTSFDKGLFFSNYKLPKYTKRTRKKNTTDINENYEFSDLKFNLDTRPNISSRFEKKSKTNLFN